MSYAYGLRTALGQTGLGYDVQIDTPIGVQTVSFDLDKVSKDVATAVVAEAYPLVEQRARKSLPSFVNEGYSHAQPLIRKEVTHVEDRAKKLGLELAAGLALSIVGANLLSALLTGAVKGGKKKGSAWP